jgi:polyisoprenoid-binding protein YceI
MKSKTNIIGIKKSILMSVIGLLMLSIWIVSCSKDNSVEPLTGGSSTGSDIIDSRAGGNYTADKSHSNVMWETFYYGDNALLTGRFNMFGLSVYFNEATPANSELKGWVQLSTFNTGEPGRDDFGKCGPGYMGIAFDTISASPLVLSPKAETDTAWFTSTSVQRYGNGYVAKGQFNLRNITKPVDFYFSYLGQHNYQSGSGTTTRAGFAGYFEINALTDFGIPATSIADRVKIRVNANYRKL